MAIIFFKVRNEGGKGRVFNRLFQNKNRKTTTTEVVFQKTVCNVPWKVGTQETVCTVSTWQEIESYIRGMFADSDEFVTLTTGDALYHIRYVQATQSDKGIIVQLGIEEGEKTRLVEKECSQKECMDIFREFYNTQNVRERGKYKPVEFFI